jgi:8-oxo-dGTP pyrophosphatase MutT (NUDIX family)
MVSEITVSTDEQQDKTFAVAPELSHLKVTLNGFLKENGEIDRLVVSALIFCQERLLVIQRAKTDTFPGCWEVPGGMCHVNDETIFHGLAREVYEEAGLQMVEVKSGRRFETPGKRFKKQWLKLSFKVAVAETECDSEGNLNPVDYRHVKVLLNPDEHQEFAWLKKEEVEQGGYDGRDMDFKFVRPLDRAVMLQAFEMREKYKSEMGG